MKMPIFKITLCLLSLLYSLSISCAYAYNMDDPHIDTFCGTGSVAFDGSSDITMPKDTDERVISVSRTRLDTHPIGSTLTAEVQVAAQNNAEAQISNQVLTWKNGDTGPQTVTLKITHKQVWHPGNVELKLVIKDNICPENTIPTGGPTTGNPLKISIDPVNKCELDFIQAAQAVCSRNTNEGICKYFDQAENKEMLNPSQFIAQGTAGEDIAGIQIGNISQRMSRMQTSTQAVSLPLDISGLGFDIQGQHVPLGYLTEVLRSSEEQEKTPANQAGRLSFYLNGNASFGKKSNTLRDEAHLPACPGCPDIRRRGEQGYDFSTRGLTLGVDYLFPSGYEKTRGFIAGIAVGYSDSQADFEHNAGDMDMQGRIFSLYGKYSKDHWSLDLIYSHGRMRFDNKRILDLEAFDPENNELIEVKEILLSTPSGRFNSINIGAAYTLLHTHKAVSELIPSASNNIWIRPSVRLHYLESHIGGFSERGYKYDSSGNREEKPLFALEIDPQRTDSLLLTAGASAAITLRKSGLRKLELLKRVETLVIQGGLNFVHQFADDSRRLTGRYLQNPEQEAVLHTDEPDRGYAVFNLATAALWGSKSLGFYYQKTIARNDISFYTLGMRFSMAF